jgi:hypothetical protein
MRALKTLVIVLGVALVAGSVALVALIVGRLERKGAETAAAQGLGPLHAALPAGSRIVSTELSGDRLLLRLALADGGEELMLVDARTGAPVAVFDVPAAR